MRVPVDRPTPRPAYQSPPRSMMAGTVDSVSTLLTTVGLAKRPCTAGNGGLMRGIARSPLAGVRGEVAGVHPLGQDRPLRAGADPGAAPPPQPRPLPLLVRDRLGGHPERLARRLVPAGREVPLDRPRVIGMVAEALGD